MYSFIVGLQYAHLEWDYIVIILSLTTVYSFRVGLQCTHLELDYSVFI